MPKILKLKHFFEIRHQAQKVGNCSWINNMTSVHAIMLLSKIKEKESFEKSFQRANDRQPFSFEESETFKGNLLDIRKKYKSLVREIKKEEACIYLKKYKNEKAVKELVKDLREKQAMRLNKEKKRKEDNEWISTNLFFSLKKKKKK